MIETLASIVIILSALVCIFSFFVSVGFILGLVTVLLNTPR